MRARAGAEKWIDIVLPEGNCCQTTKVDAVPNRVLRNMQLHVGYDMCASFCFLYTKQPLNLNAEMVILNGHLNSSTMDSSTTDSIAADVLRAPRALKDLPEFSRTSHTIVAVCLGIIFVLGFLGNFCVLVIFARFQVLWTPINLLLVNICVSDMLVCIFGTPFSFAASIYGRWLIGIPGCKWYGFANSFFGKQATVNVLKHVLCVLATMYCQVIAL